MENVDYLPYDQRHFEQKNCITILREFKDYFTKEKNFEFKGIGNNSVMWKPPRCKSGSGFSIKGECCFGKQDITLQEFLEQLCSNREHYSTGDTVAVHMIAFAIIMGCNPKYLSGIDLNYSKGYANGANVPLDHYTMWQDNSDNLVNDLKILNECALKRGIRIINLNKDAWHNIFETGDFNE